MDRKDEIILQQMDLIRSMTERNLRSMDTDFWGTPLMENRTARPQKSEKTEKPEKAAPQTQAAKPEGKGRNSPQGEDRGPAGGAGQLCAAWTPLRPRCAASSTWSRSISCAGSMTCPPRICLCTWCSPATPAPARPPWPGCMARIYHSLDILSKGQLVEVDRSGLVAGYVGQTALKTQKVIEKAMGGVLFIDEAYALNGRSENDFGQEAIDTILKAMEDHRDDLVVIVAGYTELMDRFIHSNPGLESRFNRFLMFEDYTPEQMVAIFKMQCKKGCYVLAQGTEELVRDFIAEESADDSFGNARGVRNLFEHILVAQNNRLAKMENVTRDDLMQILPDDVLSARGKIDE